MLCGAIWFYLSFPGDGEMPSPWAETEMGVVCFLVWPCDSTSSASGEVPPLNVRARLPPALTLHRRGAKWGHQEAILAEKVFASAGRDAVVNVQIKIWVWSPQPPHEVGWFEFSSISSHEFLAQKRRAQEAEALVNWGNPPGERGKISHGWWNRSQQKTRSKARGRGDER